MHNCPKRLKMRSWIGETMMGKKCISRSNLPILIIFLFLLSLGPIPLYESIQSSNTSGSAYSIVSNLNPLENYSSFVEFKKRLTAKSRAFEGDRHY